MNRNEEYRALMLALEPVPEALNGTLERALAREKVSLKRRRRFTGGASGIAACFVAFVLMVNLFPTFAYACGNVPLLRELAKAVAWSPSLSAAVENEYVQPIGLTETKNDITATVEYVIVDRKKLSIFYTLDFDAEKIGGDVYADYRYADIESWAGTAGSTAIESGALEEIDLDFVEGDVPNTLSMTISVYAVPRRDPFAAPERVFEDTVEKSPHYAPDYLAELDFTLEFDPYFTAQGETIAIGADVVIDSQKLTLTEVEVYPTHLRINLDDALTNTAWLKGLDLYLENERGERFESSINGISAMGDPDGEGYATFWLDSPFFSRGEELTLHITSAKWLDKENAEVRVDLKRQNAEGLAEGVRFLKAEKRGNVWWLSFAAPRETDGAMYQLFNSTFRDEVGNTYDIMQWSSIFGYEDPQTGESMAEDTMFTDTFPLEGFDGEVVYLEPVFSRTVDFSGEPVAIKIK